MTRKEICKEIGQRLKDAREKTRFSVEEAARAIGAAAWHFRAIERGETPVTLTAACELALLYGVPITTLLPGAAVRALDSLLQLALTKITATRDVLINDVPPNDLTSRLLALSFDCSKAINDSLDYLPDFRGEGGEG